jgi:hypothetical protein
MGVASDDEEEGRDLVGGALHIAFEWQTVVEMAVLLAEVDGNRTPEQTAYLEAGLLHYRCLVNFCCGNAHGEWHPNDMKPADFLERAWWPPDEEFDRRLRGRLPLINQDVAPPRLAASGARHHLAVRVPGTRGALPNGPVPQRGPG